MQADNTDNKSRMRSKVTLFQRRQSDVPCNKYVSDEIIMDGFHLIQCQWCVMHHILTPTMLATSHAAKWGTDGTFLHVWHMPTGLHASSVNTGGVSKALPRDHVISNC